MDLDEPRGAWDLDVFRLDFNVCEDGTAQVFRPFFMVLLKKESDRLAVSEPLTVLPDLWAWQAFLEKHLPMNKRKIIVTCDGGRDLEEVLQPLVLEKRIRVRVRDPRLPGRIGSHWRPIERALTAALGGKNDGRFSSEVLLQSLTAIVGKEAVYPL